MGIEQVNQFISAYHYERGSLIDGVRLIDGRPWEGDCDDFAWTILVLLKGSQKQALTALDRGEAVLWRAKSPVNKLLPRHVVLWVKGHGYIDSTNRKWRDSPAPQKLKYKISKGTLFGGRFWGATIGDIFR